MANRKRMKQERKTLEQLNDVAKSATAVKKRGIRRETGNGFIGLDSKSVTEVGQ
jgi:hypothetical protein